MSEPRSRVGVEPPTGSGSQLIITYRSLRLALVLAVMMLAVAVVAEIVRSGGMRGSISAYFYSPVRSVFVGALLVIGFSLVVIHVPHRWEESLLTLGGMLAIVVAFVPTGVSTCSFVATVDEPLEAGDPLPHGAIRDIADRALLDCFPHQSGDGMPGWVVAGAWNNALALVVTGIIAVAVTARFTDWSPGQNRRPLTYALAAYLGLLVAGSVAFAVSPSVRFHLHLTAALLTFTCFGVVAAIGGWSRDENTGMYKAAYQVVTAGMALGVAAFFAMRWLDVSVANDIFWLEALEIGLFGIFWLVQTMQHWDDRGSALAANRT